MTVTDIERNPSPRELRWFGVILLACFGVVGALARWRGGWPTAALVVWFLGATLATLHFALPPLRRPLYVGWMRLVYPVGWTVSHVLLGGIFLLLLTPIGVVRRLLGRDPVRRPADPGASSYWAPRPIDGPVARYFRQS
jgi:hypothetical protein